MIWTTLALVVLGLTQAASTTAPTEPEPPSAEAIADGVWMLKGDLGPGRQPDGNSVAFRTADGLVVVDTGRHDWHRVGIERLVEAEGGRLAAIVNSHWHLDHIIGNAALKRDHPHARVYATGALDGAIPGFLARSRLGAEAALAEGRLGPAEAADVRLNLAAMNAIDGLRPDVVVSVDQTLAVGGRTLDLHVTDHAATEADLWIYDPASGVLATGDLITLPVPYLDTACLEGWRAALDAVAATPFRVVVPGHGPMMDRARFETYRAAFDGLADCARSDRPAEACGAEWGRSAASFYPDAPSRDRAGRYAAGYVQQVIRAPDHDERFCRRAAQAAAPRLAGEAGAGR